MSSKDIMRPPVKIEKSTLVTWKHCVHDRADREGENENLPGVGADERGFENIPHDLSRTFGALVRHQ